MRNDVGRVQYRQRRIQRRSMGMNAIAWLAIALLILWAVLRLALAITAGLLHLLWIAAIVMLVVWIFNKLRGSKAA